MSRIPFSIAFPVSLVIALSLSACSTGGGLTSAGYADSSAQADALLSGTTGSTRGADAAPKGSWQRVPKGAFADRDFSKTSLDVEVARKMINDYRASNGLKPLRLNSRLTVAAKAHSRDLAKWDRISHHGSDGSNPWKRVKRTGYQARLTAENVGTGQLDFKEVLKGWKNSPGHNKNLLLPDADHMGIALVRDPKTEFKTFWTLVLGSPVS